jgi:hypothetical protein
MVIPLTLTMSSPVSLASLLMSDPKCIYQSRPTARSLESLSHTAKSLHSCHAGQWGSSGKGQVSPGLLKVSVAGLVSSPLSCF